MKNIGEIARTFRNNDSRKWSTARMAQEVSKHQASGKPAVKRQHIEQLEAAGDRIPRYIVALAKTMGMTTDALLLGEATESTAPVIDINQTSETAGRAEMRAAINTLGICLQQLDAEARKEAGDLLQRMAENPTGRWSRRLIELIEGESIPQTGEPVGISSRTGNYHLSTQNPEPRIGLLSGSAHSDAVDASTRPTGTDNESTDSDRGKNEGGGRGGAAGAG